VESAKAASIARRAAAYVCSAAARYSAAFWTHSDALTIDKPALHGADAEPLAVVGAVDGLATGVVVAQEIEAKAKKARRARFIDPPNDNGHPFPGGRHLPR
jgi:hypothetical protein